MRREAGTPPGSIDVSGFVSPGSEVAPHLRGSVVTGAVSVEVVRVDLVFGEPGRERRQ